MIAIGLQQMDALNARSRERQIGRVLELLAQRVRGLPGEADTRAARFTAAVQAIDDGRPLGFRSDEDLTRLAALWLLPQHLRHHALAASVMIRVLNNIDRAPAERLDFIEAQIVHRER